MAPIHFSIPSQAPNEMAYVSEVLRTRNLSGDGPFTKRCHNWLSQHHNSATALLTTSGTAALELSCILAGLEAGDEVIMPSYTFPSTANAVVLRGAVPVFVDVEPATLNINPALLEQALTTRTRAIMPIHYAGVVSEMDPILDFAVKHDLIVIEDAAQSLGSTYKGTPAGLLGDCAAVSFHKTKNIVSGEGGAFITKRADFSERAEIVREKGTNRVHFLAGLVDKYTWIDVGSSFLPSELQAAVLLAQLEEFEKTTERHLEIWALYNSGLAELQSQGHITRLVPPNHGTHNGHLFALILDERHERAEVLGALHNRNVQAVFHYVPLHSSPAGTKFGRCAHPMPVTDRAGTQLIRLPLYAGLTDNQVAFVIEALTAALTGS
ncbi:MAG: dTDP-4-amino-4,6-dideoxygalactose transaminase [Pseudomonadota bacterium]